jgi:hypothetical protein
LEEYETFHEFTKYFDKDLTSLFVAQSWYSQ